MNKRQKKMHMVPYFEGIRKTMHCGAKERIHFVPFHHTWFDFMNIMNESCPNKILRKTWNKLYKMYNRKYYFTDYQRKFIQNVSPSFRHVQDLHKVIKTRRMDQKVSNTVLHILKYSETTINEMECLKKWRN